ncbi:MAG: type II toxin-antitoxin system Phd/YefM family antitoxin [Candidatus Contendobacter sp.]|mgnify:CR=1 FL=1|nr:MAG: type II toxin-antitoxin system Phd/YefM family antitoxin [Candidatus Contendobacter sp.]
MSWNIAQAKQCFSQVVKQAATEPQLIYNRNRLVVAVIDAEAFNAFNQWREHQGAKTLGEAFAELRVLAAGDENPLPVPERRDRPNAFLEILDELPD